MSHDVIHYGPVRLGAWYGALCGAQPTTGHPLALSTHQPWLECEQCLRWLAEHPKHNGGCSNQNVLDPLGAYRGVEECGCTAPVMT